MLAAQTETVINARNSGEVQSPHDQGAGWTAKVNPDTALEVHFTIDDATVGAGQAVDYELLVTNTGEKTITLPRALNWKVIDNGDLEQQYVKASVTLELRSQSAVTYITPTLDLYSTADNVDTMLIFRPGDSLRILGTSVLPAKPFGSEWAGRATLLGHLCVSTVSRTLKQSPSGRRVTHERQRMLWCTNADDRHEVNYALER